MLGLFQTRWFPGRIGLFQTGWFPGRIGLFQTRWFPGRIGLFQTRLYLVCSRQDDVWAVPDTMMSRLFQMIPDKMIPDKMMPRLFQTRWYLTRWCLGFSRQDDTWVVLDKSFSRQNSLFHSKNTLKSFSIKYKIEKNLEKKGPFKIVSLLNYKNIQSILLQKYSVFFTPKILQL